MKHFNQFQRLTGRGNASISARTGSQRCQGIRRNHMKTHTARAVGAASLFVSGVTLAHVGRRLDGGLRRDVDASPGSSRGCRLGGVDCQARWQVIDPSKGLHLRAGLTT